MSKIFYEYYRKNSKLKGVVVAIDKDTYGWSLCNAKDGFDKEKALTIAYRRAMKASILSNEDRKVYYGKVPYSLRLLFEKIHQRAIKYYN